MLDKLVIIFTQVCILFIFLVVFYFEYIRRMENSVLNEQIKNFVHALIDSIDKTRIIPKTQADYIRLNGTVNYIKHVNGMTDLNVVSELNKLSSDIQQQSYLLAFKFIMVLSIVYMVLYILIQLFALRLSVISILMQSFITVQYIGLMQYLFLTQIVTKYNTLDHEEIKNRVVFLLDEKLKLMGN